MDPGVAVLVRGYSLWFWMLLLVPLGFMVIGGGGLAYTLWHWGKSPEHQAVRGQLGRIDLFEEINARAQRFSDGTPRCGFSEQSWHTFEISIAE